MFNDDDLDDNYENSDFIRIQTRTKSPPPLVAPKKHHTRTAPNLKTQLNKNPKNRQQHHGKKNHLSQYETNYDEPQNIPTLTTHTSSAHEYEVLPDIEPPTHSLPHANKRQKVGLSQQYFTISEEMSLGIFVNRHKDEFPVRVKVSRGYYGTTDNWCISEGEYLNIHFVKYTNVVAAVDTTFGHYSIPFNSSVQFGYLHNCTSQRDVENAMKGMMFQSVGDILAEPSLPTVVKATRSWLKSKEENSVVEGDVLILQGTKGRFKPTLKCYDVATGRQKSLSSNCIGFFTTRPYDIRLYLPEIIQHFPLPNSFALFVNSSDDLKNVFQSGNVMLTHCSVETSLIATQLDSTVSMESSSPLMEIPIDLDIGVQLVQPQEQEIAQLYETTNELLNNFGNIPFQTIPTNANTLEKDPVTAEALVTCHKGFERYGIEIQHPPQLAARNGHGETSVHLQYAEGHKKKSRASSSKLNRARTTTTATENVVTNPEWKVQMLESTVLSYAKQIEKLESQLKEVVRNQEHLQDALSSLNKEFSEFKLQQYQRPPKPQPLTQEEQMQRNISELKELKLGQIMKLLRELKLQMYQQVFHTKGIDGQVLAKMNESSLYYAGITNEDHRKIIMNIINGIISPNSLIGSDF
jgi:hypothetical protein